MADKRAYFKMDVGYLTNPKVAIVAMKSPAAILLHIASIAYSAQHLTDGIVPISLLLRINGAATTDAGLLLDAGLWTKKGKDEAEVHDYLEHQRSAADAKGATAKASKAAGVRWHSEDDETMPDALPNAMLNALHDASESPMPREREREREKEQHGNFEAWWAIYPHKVAKGAAVKAYKAALKKTDAATLLSSITAQLPWFASQLKPSGDYRPMPASWLNGERWSDAAPAIERDPSDGIPWIGQKPAGIA